MSKKYKIRDGFSFVGADNKVHSGGETIVLDDDVAQQHAHKLEAADEATPKKPSKKSTEGAALAENTSKPVDVGQSTTDGVTDSSQEQ